MKRITLLTLLITLVTQSTFSMQIPSSIKKVIPGLPDTLPVEKKERVSFKEERFIKQDWEHGLYKIKEFKFPRVQCPICDRKIYCLLTDCVGYDTTKDFFVLKGWPVHEDEFLHNSKLAQLEPHTEDIMLIYHCKTGDTAVFASKKAPITFNSEHTTDFINITDFAPGLNTYDIMHDEQGIYSLDLEIAWKASRKTRKEALDSLDMNDQICNINAIMRNNSKRNNLKFSSDSIYHCSQDNAIVVKQTMQNQNNDIGLTVFGVKPCKPLVTLDSEPVNKYDPVNVCHDDKNRRDIFVNADGTEIYYFDSMTLQCKIFVLHDKPSICFLKNKDAFFRYQ